MEFPARAMIEERALTAVVLAAALAAAFIERGGAVATAAREARSYSFEVGFAGSPERFAAVLQPAARRLWLIEGQEAQGPLLVLPGARPAGEAPLSAKQALLPRRLSQWADLLRAGGEMPVRDRFFLMLEIARMRADDVRAARLPEDAADRALLTAAVEGPSESGGAPASWASPPTVEVFNASSARGLAGVVTRRLRERGADVLASGNAAQTRERTVVYDRMGRPDRADWIRARLGCPEAETETRVDRKRLVDATVELGEDCAQALRKALAADPEKS